jgi:hypothetical protein
MIRTAVSLIAFTVAAPALAAERRYAVTDFDRIQVDGPYQVTLVTGRSSSAIASGDQAALERVSVEVQGKVLRIRPNRSAWGGPAGGTGPVRIAVTTQDLRGATVIGSGGIEIDRARAMRFDANLSGSGRIAIRAVEVDTLGLGLLGGGKLLLGGKAKSLRATISGSGDLEAAGLRVEDADLKADTSGTISLAVGRAAKIQATGAGDVTVTGRPACTVKQTGAGRVTCGS